MGDTWHVVRNKVCFIVAAHHMTHENRWVSIGCHIIASLAAGLGFEHAVKTGHHDNDMMSKHSSNMHINMC